MIKTNAEPIESGNPWRLYFIGDEKNPFASEFMQSIKDLPSSEDKQSASRGLEMLIKHAANGAQLRECYDKKTCHEAFSFTHKGIEHKIWRIRKNDVRIYFYYVEGMILLLPRVGEKREDSLTEAQKAEIAAPVKIFLDSGDKIQFKECDDEQ